MLKITSKIYPLILLLAVLTLLSCSDDRHSEKNKNEGTPITFISSEQEETNVSRAATPLNYDFTAYGYKTTPTGVTQTIFEGYKVKYLGIAGTSNDNTHGYAYVDPATKQSIKYWDMKAQSYNFWGYTGSTSTMTVNAGNAVLTFTDLQQTTTDPTSKDNLFSSLYHRSPVTNDVVRLEFKRPYAKVCVKFHAGGQIASGDNVKVNQVTFGPIGTDKKIISSGKLQVTYPKTGEGPETYTTLDPSGTKTVLNFPREIELNNPDGNSANTAIAVPVDANDASKTYYYVVPNNYDVPFLMTASIEEEAKTAIVPQELMNWQPNYTYTYIFKILETGKNIEFYDVKIEPWHYGGAQDKVWNNW